MLLVFVCGCAAQPPAEGLAFAALGDAPYSEAEVERLERLIDELNAQPLAFVVHVGDIGSSRLACSDAWLEQRKAQFARIRHPFVLLPGDNEWANCNNPLERLKQWRKLFCQGRGELAPQTQPGEYCEHMRWEAGGQVFVALNVPGHDNNAGHAEHAPRMKAVLAWLDEAARRAETGDQGLVVLMQANPLLPRGFGALTARLERLAAERPGKVLLVHGDTHIYRDDEPIPGLRRIEVWGSPIVGWTRVPFSELPSRSPR